MVKKKRDEFNDRYAVPPIVFVPILPSYISASSFPAACSNMYF